MSAPPIEPPLPLAPLACVPPPLLLLGPNTPPSPLLSLLQPHGGSGWGLRQAQTDPGPPAVQAPSHRPAAATSAPAIHGFRLLSTPIAPTGWTAPHVPPRSTEDFRGSSNLLAAVAIRVGPIWHNDRGRPREPSRRSVFTRWHLRATRRDPVADERKGLDDARGAVERTVTKRPRRH